MCRLLATVVQAETTYVGDEQIDDEYAHGNTENHNPLIPPKLLPPHGPRAPSKRPSLTSHCIRLVDEQLDPLAST